MDRRHAQRTIQRLARNAGVNDWEHIGPHDIRHTAIAGVLDATGNIDKAHRFAHHASPVTTQVYDHRNKKLEAPWSNPAAEEGDVLADEELAAQGRADRSRAGC